MERLDEDLITLLKHDARASVTELATRLGTSRATTKAHLDRLIQSGRIRRFTIDVDVEDPTLVRAVMLIEIEGPLVRKVSHMIRRLRGIADLYTTSGDWDLVAMTETRDLADFDRLLREVREVNGVTNSRTQILLTRE